MKIFCVGRNYAEHAKELNNEIPEEPVIFMKPKTAYTPQPPTFIYPEFTNELHYEAELVLRVCKNGKYIEPHHALQYVDAITVGIDFTARDLQRELKKKGLPWEIAKAWDNSALTGEFIKIKPEALNRPIHFSLERNGEVVQRGNTANMLYTIPKLITYISRFFSLNIGDLIFTGTPEGVGECSVGDELTGYLEGEKMFYTYIK
ncbi:fumarylacetoacetate hydrolase family protein [Ilyomonas limi]|uniref:Fumarylacetoacetate hydrolase family protein n=1 Tax=Ilyomonas limi TaxID=2575867 RepID=A0A4U3L2J4_9BACT|nr:fumarylacetoacetate hydrolase family protein [Ilyomonas limi]TKK67776.1 fumarylacetoacetate hydrolase family protein [Ilyomonas limi]